MDQNNATKYIIYVRKSSETEDRQVLSIESQIKELKEVAERQGLRVIDIIQESISAKNVGRPGFARLLKRLESGEVDGIICWKLDRLARNMVDGGAIINMLLNKVIRQIKTVGKDYNTDESVLMMSVEFGMANQFVVDLGKNTRRGLKAKADKGWYPGVAKPGYLNDKYCDKGEKKILKDSNGFELIKKVFRYYLTGVYTVNQLHTKLNEEWGYRTPKRKRLGGRPMSKSTLYRILSDPFYYGKYEYPSGSGQWYQGMHEPMITEKEFNKIQVMLGKATNPRPTKNNHVKTAFYGQFKCFQCGSAITPDKKINVRCTVCKHKFSAKHAIACPKCHTKISAMKNPSISTYIYYTCSHKKDPNCRQPSIEQEDLDDQINKILSGITITDDLRDWFIEELNKENSKKAQFSETTLQALQEAYSDCQKRQSNLLSLKISPQNTDGSVLSDEAYNLKNNEIKAEMAQVKEKLDNLELSQATWSERAVKFFNFACYAKHHYENGTDDERKAILLGLGSNQTILNKQVLILLPKYFAVAEKFLSRYDYQQSKFEPGNFFLYYKKSGIKLPDFSMMLPGWDSDPRPIGYTYPLVA